MTATQLIRDLQDLVRQYGDKEIEVNGEYNNNYPINTASRLSIARVDLFNDSANYQLMVDNSF